jgi:hypothetical protein
MAKNEIVLRGYWCWLAPLVLILATVIAVYWIGNPLPMEHFDLPDPPKDNEEEKKKSPRERLNKKSTGPQPMDAGAPMTATDEMNEPFANSTPFFENTVQSLQKGWRDRKLPRTLEPYHGSVMGYNCGQYSEFTLGYSMPPCFRDREELRCYPVTGKDSDYIFPDSPVTKGDIRLDCPVMQEEDVKRAYGQARCKKLATRDQERLSPSEVDQVARPQYMYHRGDGYGDTLVGFGKYA